MLRERRKKENKGARTRLDLYGHNSKSTYLYNQPFTETRRLCTAFDAEGWFEANLLQTRKPTVE